MHEHTSLGSLEHVKKLVHTCSIKPVFSSISTIVMLLVKKEPAQQLQSSTNTASVIDDVQCTESSTFRCKHLSVLIVLITGSRCQKIYESMLQPVFNCLLCYKWLVFEALVFMCHLPENPAFNDRTLGGVLRGAAVSQSAGGVKCVMAARGHLHCKPFEMAW